MMSENIFPMVIGNPEKNWYDIFVADQKEILYIRNIISGGEKLYENARIWLSTIHAIKGGEEDNVILFTSRF